MVAKNSAMKICKDKVEKRAGERERRIKLSLVYKFSKPVYVYVDVARRR